MVFEGACLTSKWDSMEFNTTGCNGLCYLDIS